MSKYGVSLKTDAMSKQNSFNIRHAKREDAQLILSFIKELAEYEKMSADVVADVASIENTLFDGSGRTITLLAEVDDKPAGFAVCFYNYSTFQGKFGIYLEDLYVKPEYRGHGIGKGFFHYLSQRAVNENCGRIQWWCLNWNQPSIDFYKSMDAKAMDEWTVFRLEGASIQNLIIEEKAA